MGYSELEPFENLSDKKRDFIENTKNPTNPEFRNMTKEENSWYQEIFPNDPLSKNNKNPKGNESEKEVKNVFKAYKYSNKGKGKLYEAIVLEEKQCFINYNENSQMFEQSDYIEESSRIISPPSSEEYPYTPYEFENMDDLNEFLSKASQIKSIDELYYMAKHFFELYVDQDQHTIVVLASDSILTYFQDLFSVIHYAEAIGANDVGKSSIGYTFEYTGYRVVKGTSISGPNYYRLLGTVEPGQCTIIEDEGDSISEDPDKIRILKAGYELNGKVPKINSNTKNQEQKWFFAFCYKMVLAEKSLSQWKAPGLVDRTFTFKCRPGSVKYSIKKVVSDTINKSSELKGLNKQLIDFRKLMLCYRLLHYRDSLPEIKINLINRDEELTFPSIQLFHGTRAFEEIKQALEFFVKQRRERKSNTIEAALYPILDDFISKDNRIVDSQSNGLGVVIVPKSIAIPFSELWNKIASGGIEGRYDSNKPNEYETVAYGKLYNNTLSSLIADKFGAVLNKKSKGSVLIFDKEKFARFRDVYQGRDSSKEINIIVKPNIEQSAHEGIREGYDGNDGFEDPMAKKSKIIKNDSANPVYLEKDIPLIEPSQPSLPSSSTNRITFHKCPHCNFRNIYPDTIAHHIRYTRDKAHNQSVSDDKSTTTKDED